VARKLKRPYIRILGSGLATDCMALSQRQDLTLIRSATLALERSLAMSGKKRADIQFAEVHDCFTIAELMILESICAYPPGKAGPATQHGETALDGKFPVNSSGGLKAKGHPVGATGVAQVVEIYKQLTGKAEKGRQIPGSKTVGMAQNMGGTGASSVVHIMEVGR
jgi:acetyl-CoA C-acetyltransferase